MRIVGKLFSSMIKIVIQFFYFPLHSIATLNLHLINNKNFSFGVTKSTIFKDNNYKKSIQFSNSA